MSDKKYHTIKGIISKIPSDKSRSSYSIGVSAIFTITIQDEDTIVEFTDLFISNVKNDDIENVLTQLNLKHEFENNPGKHIIIDGVDPKITCQETVQ